MAIRAKRRAWARRVMSDPSLPDFDRQLALAVAGIDRRGIMFCRMDGELFVEPRPQYAANLAAA